MHDPGTEHLLLLWGKTSTDAAKFHPLLCHLVDAANVCRMLWDQSFSDALRGLFSTAMRLPEEACSRWLPFLVGLHDLGKATPAFQRRWQPGWQRVLGAGYKSPVLVARNRHDHMAVHVLPVVLEQRGIARPASRHLARILASHHGTFPTASWITCTHPDDERWAAAREGLASTLAEVCGVAGGDIPQTHPDAGSGVEVLLAGLTCLSDWVASSERFFPPAGEVLELDAYVESSRRRAEAAASELGWGAWEPTQGARTFAEQFEHAVPTPLQEAAIGAGLSDGRPDMIIVEAPTGCGKTEVGLALAAERNRLLGQQGVYVGLPTQATSNQMFGRVREFLERAYADQRVNLHLTHGDAAQNPDYRRLQVMAAKDPEGEPGVVAESWFCSSKRALLAPFGVGTIDQALLSVLQTRHWFLRLFGLAGKTIIVDEVHAYDAYTSRLLDRLLQWCARLGTSVILLSATLPAARRRELLAAYSGEGAREAAPASYPRISRGRGSDCEAFALPPPELKENRLDWKPHDAVLADLVHALADGGCAAFICNTVGEAQRVYRDARGLFGDGEVMLFHSRFTRSRRRQIEGEVTERFGKDGARPDRALLVATQVVEQSLDLDFDLMVSELAPADLVIQRAGRLHRHARSRPASLDEPHLWLLEPEKGEDGLPRFGGSAYVYERYVLLRSYLALRDRSALVSPQGVEELIDAVYDDALPRCPDQSWEDALRGAFECFAASRRQAEQEAESKLVPEPCPGVRIMDQPSWDIEDGNPEVERRFRGLTRLGRPSVRAVCLHRMGEGLYLDPHGCTPVDVGSKPTDQQARAMLDNVLQISHPAIFGALIEAGVPAGWQGSPWLCWHYPLVFTDGACAFGNYRLTLDDELGLSVHRLDGEGE